MNLKLPLTFFFCIVTNVLFSKNSILVVEKTIVLNFDETKELFFSLAEGDVLLFDMKMIRGKHIKEIEILEMPFHSLLTEFKSRGFKNRQIQIKNKGIYKFRFFSSSLTRRVCKIVIKRIPKNESTRNFNTNWKWETKLDTLFTPYQTDSLIGYQTIKYQETVRELKVQKMEEIMLFEKSQRVHSYYNSNPSRTYLRVDLPQVQNTLFREERLVAWVYWIGVGQESLAAYKKDTNKMSSLIQKGANLLYGSPLAGIAIGAISEMIKPKIGEDIAYYFISDFSNVQLFLSQQQFYLFDSGKGVAGFGRNDAIKQGTFYIGLHNDNLTRGIDVNVKVLAIKEVKVYENVTYDKEKQEPQYVTLNKTKMNVVKNRMRVPVE